MDIQVGQQWRTRGGDTVAVESYDSGDSTLPWRVTSVGLNTGNRSWRTAEGRYYDDGRICSRDLIELVTPTPPAPAQLDTLRLTIAASIYAGMLEGNYLSPAPRARDAALRDLARRALSHADILIQEAAR